MIKSLEKQLNGNNDSFNMLEYIKKEQPDLFLDLEKAYSFLLSTQPELTKACNVLKILKTKEYIDSHRIHSKTKRLIPYQIYKESFSGDLEEELFNNLYKAVNMITISDEIEKPSDNTISAIKVLGTEIDNKERLYRFISKYFLYGHKLNYDSIIKKSEFKLNEYINIIAKYNEIQKIIKPNPSALIELMCFAEKINISKSVLENRFVYQKFRLLIDDSKFNSQPIIIINPSLLFIRKWICKNVLFNRETVFVIEDTDKLYVLNSIYSKLDAITFVSIKDMLKTYLVSTNRISDILIFINNTENKSEIANILHQLPMSLNKENNLYIFTQDSFVTNNKSIIKQSLKDYNISLIYILPFININKQHSNKYILLKSNYSKIKSDIIQLKGFSCSDSHNPSLITKSNYININYDDFFSSNIDIRKIYYNQTRKEEKKTNQERKSAQKYNLTENIAIYYTDSNKNEMHRVKACFKNPLTNQRIENSCKSTKILKEEVEHWLKYEYISKIEKRTLNEIKELYKRSFLGIDISLDTFLFLEDKIYNSIPDDYKYLYEELLNSDIASLPISSINSYDLDLFISSIDKATYKQTLTIINSIFIEAVKNVFGNLKVVSF